MQKQQLILTTLGSGAAIGLLLGLTTNTTMLAPREPAWKQVAGQSSTRPELTTNAGYQFVDAGPQDLGTGWDAMNRLPTWKREAAARETAAIERRYTVYIPETRNVPYHPEDADLRDPPAAADAAPAGDPTGDARGGQDLQQSAAAAEERDPAADSDRSGPDWAN